MRTSALPLLIVVLLPACGVAVGEDFHAHDGDDFTSSSTSTGEGDGTSPGPITSTVTTSPTAGTDDGGSTEGDTEGATSEADPTSPDPAAPPSISDHSLTPQPITIAGPIAVKITADADGVRMDLAGSSIELTPTEPGLFEGEILALTGFDHGGVARFTPWRGDVEGEALEVPYTIALPTPGGAALFDVDDESGQVAAMAPLLEGGVVELVTLVDENNVSGCYLRRRDEQGLSGPDDLFTLLPDHCKGIDLETGPDGIYVLIDGETLGGWMWWAAKVEHFGAWPTTLGYGEDDETARDLAVSPSGIVAVCGAAPTKELDLSDAFVTIYRPGLPEHTTTFDHQPGGKYHIFDEDARGCDFLTDDRLIMVGSAYGKFENWNVKITRRFDLLYDLETDDGELRVASAGGLANQSVATAVTVDRAQGRAFVVGHIFNDDLAEFEGQLWMMDPEGDLATTTSLGLHSLEALVPNTVRVSAAGHIIIASGGLAGSEPAFVVRAYAPLKAEPLWTYAREDVGLVHLAHALATGRYGEIYAGGFGASGHPLFVLLHG